MAGSLRPCNRILVMNDNEDLVASIRDLLELEGSSVETATSAQQAIGILAAGFEPQVFVIDLLLGGGASGEEFARFLRQDPRFGARPIVFISGAVEALRDASAGLADAMLQKPFDVEQLYTVLSDLCAVSEAPGPVCP
jgi:CheY-like chemotaxis protein